MTKDVLSRGFRWALTISAVLHGVTVCILLVVGTHAGRTAKPPRRALTTKLVRLGKPRPKELLPRKAAPLPPAQPAAVAVPSAKKKPAPRTKPKPKPKKRVQSARDRIADMTRVRSALDRLKSAPDAEGHPDGSPDGDVADAQRAIIGSRFITEVYGCLKANYAVEGIDPKRVQGRLAQVWVRVAPDGTIVESKIEKSSGLKAFDRAVERAVKRCRKVGPPDPAIRDDVVNDGIEVEFQP